jgi:hypothetical protein
MAKIKAKTMNTSIGQIIEPQIEKTILQQIEEMKASGQTNTQEFKQKTKELEVMLGIDTINPFGTNELDIFEDHLREITYADMKKLAQRVGINPNYDRSSLKTILIKEFKSVNKNNRRNIIPNSLQSVQLDPKNPDHAALLKILGEF